MLLRGTTKEWGRRTPTGTGTIEEGIVGSVLLPPATTPAPQRALDQLLKNHLVCA